MGGRNTLVVFRSHRPPVATFQKKRKISIFVSFLTRFKLKSFFIFKWVGKRAYSTTPIFGKALFSPKKWDMHVEITDPKENLESEVVYLHFYLHKRRKVVKKAQFLLIPNYLSVVQTI